MDRIPATVLTTTASWTQIPKSMKNLLQGEGGEGETEQKNQTTQTPRAWGLLPRTVSIQAKEDALENIQVVLEAALLYVNIAIIQRFYPNEIEQMKLTSVPFSRFKHLLSGSHIGVLIKVSIDCSRLSIIDMVSIVVLQYVRTMNDVAVQQFTWLPTLNLLVPVHKTQRSWNGFHIHFQFRGEL